MAYDVILFTPEAPIRETVRWVTEEFVANDGSESHLTLRNYPKRIFSGTVEFADVADARLQILTMWNSFGGSFKFPMFQYQVRLKVSASSGGDTVTVNALRSEFRVGEQAIIIEGSTYELLTVESQTSTSVTFTTNLTKSYTKRAIVCPVTEVYADKNAPFSRSPNGEGATMSFTYNEIDPWVPFLNPLNSASLVTFDGFPVFDYIATGTAFESALDTNLVSVDYNARPDVFTDWTLPKTSYPVKFICPKIGSMDTWESMMLFLNTVVGSRNEFLFPTNRSDLVPIADGDEGDTQIVVKGTIYSDFYWGLDTYKRIVIESDAGRHYAEITGVVTDVGNNVLYFTPAVPAGTGRTSNQKVSFMLKVRNSSDEVVIDHYPLHNELSFQLRTVL